MTAIWIINLIIHLFVQITTLKLNNTNFIKENVTITIDQGILFGKKSFNYWNGTYYSFEGIPYAKPPIGVLRFRAPELAEPWSGIYDATQIRPICPQVINSNTETPNSKLEQNEDCLFLNIHSKMTTDLKPVMIWIFGGGMKTGSIFDDSYGPELLMTEDIVLVKVSYRLNVFGFLRIDDPKYGIHGNAGLKDILLALKWVQRNIHHFSGDSNQVTIFGGSAGGTAVNLLYLSPRITDGLFHRAIIQSGSAGLTFLTTNKKYPELADILNCTSTNLDESIKCVNDTTTATLLSGYQKLNEMPHFNEVLQCEEIFPFNILSIEKENNTNSFLVESPENLARSGKFNQVPIIMGFNTHEGQAFTDVHPLKPNFTEYRSLIPVDIEIDLASEDAFKLGKRIKELYYGNQTPSYKLMDPYIDQDTSAYLYEFNYYTKLNLFQNTIKKYIAHRHELRYLFYTDGVTPKNMDSNSDEFIAIHRMIKLWTTFATSTNANPINDPLLNYLTDSMFLEKTYKFAKLQSTVAKNTPAYFYEFNYYTKLNLKPDTTKKYVTHGDEIGYLFYKEGLTPKNMDPNSDEFIAIHRMIKLWTSFATSTNANPNPINDPLLNVKWLPVEPNKFNYLKISQNLELKQNPIDDRMKFWEEVYQQYNSR